MKSIWFEVLEGCNLCTQNRFHGGIAIHLEHNGQHEGRKTDFRRTVHEFTQRGRSVNSLRLRRRLLLCVLWTFTLDCKQVAHQQRRRPRFKRIVFSIFHRLPSAKPEVLFEPAHSDVSSRCRSEAIPCHPFATQQFWCRKRKAKATAIPLAMRQKCLSETK